LNLAFSIIALLAFQPFLYSGQLDCGFLLSNSVPALTARTVPTWSCGFVPPAVPMERMRLDWTSAARSLISAMRNVAPGQSRWMFDLNSRTVVPLISTAQ
jgi:hypothetical protein